MKCTATHKYFAAPFTSSQRRSTPFGSIRTNKKAAEAAYVVCKTAKNFQKSQSIAKRSGAPRERPLLRTCERQAAPAATTGLEPSVRRFSSALSRFRRRSRCF